MTEREVVRAALRGERPPYVPWSFRFTREARAVLRSHFGTDELEAAVGNHILELGSDIGFFEDLGGDRVRDVFGVVWDRTRGQGHRQRRGDRPAGPQPDGLRVPRPARPALLRRHPGQDRPRPRPLPRLLHRLLALRAGLDAARHGEPAGGLRRPPGLRPRAARGRSPTTTSPRSGRRCATTSTPSTSATTGASSAA